MIKFMRTGHRARCFTPDECKCIALMYGISGGGALLASAVTLYVGSTSSMAVLSDSPHAANDAAGDGFMLGRVLWYGRPEQERVPTGLLKHPYTWLKWIGSKLNGGYDSLRSSWRKRKGLDHVHADPRWKSRLFLALMLFSSAALIGYEAIERFLMDAYPINMKWAFGATATAAVIHLFRWLLLRVVRKPDELHLGVVAHAWTDFLHATIVAGFLALAWYLESIGIPYTVLRSIDMVVTICVVLYLSWKSWTIWQGTSKCSHDHGIGIEHHAHS